MPLTHCRAHIQALLFHPGPQPIHIPGCDLHVGIASVLARHFIRRIFVQNWGFWFLCLLGFLGWGFWTSQGHHYGLKISQVHYILIKEHHVVPESGSFSAAGAAAAASSDFLPLFMFGLGLTANTPRTRTRTRTASTHSNADAAEKKEKTNKLQTGSRRVF